jgi:hypothetical protein
MFEPQLVDRFPRFTSIGCALGAPAIRIPASELRDEVLNLHARLKGRTVEMLAIAPATASVLYMGARLSASRTLTAHEREQVAPAAPGEDLAQYFASLCESIVQVCAAPYADCCVQVVDG